MTKNTTAKNLVIVESPAKAKTIEKYLGKDYKVMASVGHIRAIAKNSDVPAGMKAVDPDNGFATIYVVDTDKKKTVRELKAAVKEADTVWLASDEDREGEAIAWHLCEVLDLPVGSTHRLAFHEITKPAIETALKNPRTVDLKMVEAQQARQILDRLVGFELSPVIWQKVPGGKSAGRVQSPAVRLLVEREREIQAFDSKFNFKVTAIFAKNEDFKAILPKTFATEDEAKKFLESLIDKDFKVDAAEKKPGVRKPGPPFTTSTLQQEANSRLGYGTRATMGAAQKLYQEGKITYMRTDSVNLSKQFLAAADNYIKGEFGAEYHQFRTFTTKSAGAQEAHEAIRPTDVSLELASSDPSAQKIYELIRNRALATQMADAKTEKTVIKIGDFEAKGEIITFAGFTKIYGAKKDEILPDLAVGDSVNLIEATARQTFDRPPARYTEGSLVKELEKRGIGRPSTYATIIGNILTRGYVEKGENEGADREIIEVKLDKGVVNTTTVIEKTGSDKGKLVPTSIGMLIADFLTDHFPTVVDYEFTAKIENELDKIAESKLERNKVLNDFYLPFHKLVESAGGIDRATVSKAREVGIDPKSGKPIFARFTKFGPALQLGPKNPEDKTEKATFAPMPAGTRVESVTLEEALHAFELPRVVGKTDDGQEIIANIGRFGPYIKVGSLFVSIKPLDPHKITEIEAKKYYAEKLKAEAEKNIADFGEIKVLNGRYGAYIRDEKNKANIKIPKDIEPKSITEAMAKKIIAETPTPKGRYARKKPTKKK